MDPLSDVLALLRPKSYVSRGFGVDHATAIRWPKHEGIKCYALLSGQCSLRVEGVAETVALTAGDCFLLPRGRPLCLATDLSIEPMDFEEFRRRGVWETAPNAESSAAYMVGGHFLLSGTHAEELLASLPPIVHIREESDKAAMRWSLERMKEELRDPQPGGTLMAQQLAYMMLVQALRLHLADRSSRGVGWLFALADKQMSAAIAAMHDQPGRPWTLQSLAESVGMSRSVFAERFKETVGTTAMEYLTRWRMLVASDRMQSTEQSVAAIAASLGYESESAFGKAFRRVMGTSPRRFGRDGAGEPAAAAAAAAGEEATGADRQPERSLAAGQVRAAG